MVKGKFITFEGIDGAGKSTHVETISAYLHAKGKTVISTREPGGTPLGERLRELLLHEPMHLETEALLMFASRREHIDKLIAPALERGDWVISDRFTDASFAYQGGGRELSTHKLDILEQWVHADFQPHLTLLFDVPLDVARERLGKTRILDKFEREKNDFFENSPNALPQRATKIPHRIRVVDSTQPLAKLTQQREQLIDQLDE